jgi:deoxyribodipyrimidine photo-lyase
LTASPAIVWFRQDLRLTDHPALHAAAARQGSVVPVYIWAPDEEGDWPPGAAARVWLHHSVSSLRTALQAIGSDLLIYRGSSLDVLRRLANATGAGAVYWNRRYEPAAIQRDTAVKQALRHDGLEAQSFNGSLLFEPWDVQTKTGGPYQVFTPFWRAVLQLPEPESPLPAPAQLTLSRHLPADDGLDALQLLPSIPWDAGIRAAWTPGEAAARQRLDRFLIDTIDSYDADRNRPDLDGSSRLSPHLHHGEISPRQVWHAVFRHTRRHAGKPGSTGAATFLREIGWREFAYHLLYHFPHTPTRPLRTEFDRFPWRSDAAQFQCWSAGRTGYPIVDAGMRQLWHTGWMHNRVRMIVASFLVKDLRMSWLDGARWFWDTLVDADLASNTLGWQWAGGCGADAAPYFRVFNPVLQGEKFDPRGDYVRRFVPQLHALAARDIHKPWSLASPPPDYPPRLVDHHEARDAALAAFERVKRTAT